MSEGDDIGRSLEGAHRVAVLVLGGDLSLCAAMQGSASERHRALQGAARAVLTLTSEGYHVVVIPPAGPQLQGPPVPDGADIAQHIHRPLHSKLAAIQAQVAAAYEVGIRNEARDIGATINIASLLSHTLVASDDPGFEHPSSPIGPNLSAAQAHMLASSADISVMEQPDGCWREVAPRLRPIKPLGLSGLEAVLTSVEVVLTGAGGGVPARMEEDGHLTPIRGLLSERQLGALLAQELAADLLVMLQKPECVVMDHDDGSTRALTVVDRHELRSYLEGGRFTEPELTATLEDALCYLDDGGQAVILTNAQRLSAAISNRRGTRIGVAFEQSERQTQFTLFDDESSPHPAS